MSIDSNYLKWEFDRNKRNEYLLNLKADEPCNTDIDVFLKIMEFRYPTEKRKTVDLFMRFWLDIVFFSTRLNSGFAIKKARVQILQFLNDNSLKEITQINENGEEILLLELENSLLYYYYTCMTDPGYGGQIFGIGTPNPEKTLKKLERQVEVMSVFVPQQTNLEAEFAAVSNTINKSFLELKARRSNSLF